MPEQDFELYLSLLVKLLKLKPEQTASIRDELRDHLEARLEELSATGVDRPQAIRQALDEFGDAAVLADEFAQRGRERRRQRVLRWAMGTSAAAAAALLLTFAFWPISQVGPAPSSAQADDPATTAPGTIAASPRRTLFLDAVPTCIDPINFVPEPLRLMVGDEDLETTIGELPSVLNDQFGAVAIVDQTRLDEIGIGADAACVLRANRPLYAALDRAFVEHDLDWFWDRNVLHISTAESTRERLEAEQYVVRDLLKSMSESQLLDAIENCTGDEDYAPWLDSHGIGGTLTLLEDVLSVRQNRRGQLEVATLLAALENPRPDVTTGRSESELALRQSLRSQDVAGRFGELQLADAIQELAVSTGLPFGVDETRLSEFGVGLDTLVSLDVPPRSLGQVLDLLLEPHDLTVLVRHGEIQVTTSEFANETLQTVLLDVSDIAPDRGRTSQLIDAFESQAGNEDYGPWFNSHGIGGTSATVGAGRLVVRQTDRVLDEIRALLADIRKAAATRPAAPPVNPLAIETRYYRLPSKIAGEMLATIPRQVGVGEWNEPIEAATDRDKGTIEIVTAGTFWKQYGPMFSGGFGGGGKGGGFGGGGMEGDFGQQGGFFQFGPAVIPHPQPAVPQGGRKKRKGKANDDAESADAGGGMGGLDTSMIDPLSNFDAVLIVRHRVGVHQQLTEWLNQLLFGSPEGNSTGVSVPTGTLPGAAHSPIASQE